MLTGLGLIIRTASDRPKNPVSSVLAMSVRHSLPKQITELFEWDPTEPVAMRPMFMQYRVPGQTYALFYTHDGNKNVSEVVRYSRANGVAAHYEYAPFGEVTAQVRQGGITAYDFAALNPWRFSSEYADDASATVYYNYRHYEPVMGRWMSRDPLSEDGGLNVFESCKNNLVFQYDEKGQLIPSDLSWDVIQSGLGAYVKYSCVAPWLHKCHPFMSADELFETIPERFRKRNEKAHWESKPRTEILL